METKIDSSYMLTSIQKDERKPSDVLGKDDFLKILMTQLQNQDPLNPMEDKEFISQMASFSSLEQMTNMNTTMQNFMKTQSGSRILEYSSLIGKEVAYSYKVTDDEGNSTVKEGTQSVKSVSQKNNEVALELMDGTVIYTDEIVKVSDKGSK
ncbi:flagellar hook assembly protein FlgD [Bacillus sp. FJAT-42376]|uniref:flagellar hook assembly protein FlgD n=1 Tax=Bacillus sp. FJAT-42376 TaxID=2014076 RepID=UPI000F4F74F7|nr:flagellar hook assembly protein FlgD [Bacillus sp. FJAT-42376]AZB42943.1 flagellar hook assembly protein FlgD [Bacillus sp. FJAT-42376]